MIHKKKIAIIIAAIVLVIGLGILVYLIIERQRARQKICADNLLDVQYFGADHVNEDGFISISVKNKSAGKEISNFSLNDVYEGHYHFIEVHNCFVYLIKQFGFNYERGVFAPDYHRELWRYNFYGKGEKVFPINGGVQGIDFRVTRDETLIAMRSGAQKEGQIASLSTMIFIDLATMKETYHFSLYDLIEEGLIDEQFSVTGPGPRDWTKDGRYFWGDISVGAYVYYFFRVDTTNWKVEVFELPGGVLGGSALNIEKGYVTRHPGYVWTGIDVLTEEVKQEWREQGKVSSLYIYNLFTKDDILLATTSEPLWDFKDKWLSDTELEYELPGGEKKVYVIEE